MGIASLIADVGFGKFGGLVGTFAMDAWGYRQYRRGGGDESPAAWEFGGVDGWEDASAPGQVARKAISMLTGNTPPDSWAAPAQTLTHWGTGVGWGAALGVWEAFGKRPPWFIAGPLLGLTAWATAATVLPVVGVYKPVWKHDTKTNLNDISTHAIYGTVTAATFSALRWREKLP